MKVLIRLFIGLAVLVLIAAGVSYFILQRYLSSPEFADDISRMASEKLEGNLELDEFKISGLSASAEQIELTNSGKIESIKINGFNTDFAQWALFDRTWRMRSLECEDLRVHILRKKKNAVQVTKKKPESPIKPTSKQNKPEPTTDKAIANKKPKEKKKSPAFYKRFIPTELEFGRLKVNNFSGLVEGKKRPVQWSGVALDGDFKGDMLKLDLTGGALEVPSKILSKWEINKATVIATEDTYEVKDGSFQLKEGGSALLNGNGAISGGDLALTAQLKNVPLSSILKKQSKNAAFTGLVDGDIKVVTQNKDTVTKGTIVLNQGVLSLPSIAKPLLKFIQLDGGSDLKLDQCSSDVTHIDDKTILENLILSVGNKYRVRGNANLNGDRYSIRCRLGIAPDVHSRLPSGLQKQYTQQGSYFWIPVTQSGDKDDLAEDLGKKALVALTSSYLGESKIIDTIEKTLGGDISELLESEEGEKLKKKGLDALKKLFR